MFLKNITENLRTYSTTFKVKLNAILACVYRSLEDGLAGQQETPDAIRQLACQSGGKGITVKIGSGNAFGLSTNIIKKHLLSWKRNT